MLNDFPLKMLGENFPFLGRIFHFWGLRFQILAFGGAISNIGFWVRFQILAFEGAISNIGFWVRFQILAFGGEISNIGFWG